LTILSIDPGPKESAYIRVLPNFKHIEKGKVNNEMLLNALRRNQFGQGITVIEELIAYDRCGREISDTAFQAGRMAEAAVEYRLISRAKVRGHLCGRGGTDSKVITALIERFEPEIYNHWDENKNLMSRAKMVNDAKQGFFHGFQEDIWQAYALGVTYIDLLKGGKIKCLNLQ
jgi:hypothetical protein